MFGEESGRKADAWRPHKDALDQFAYQGEAISGEILRIAEQGGPFAEEVKRTLRTVARIAAGKDHEDWLLIFEEALRFDQQAWKCRDD